MPTAKSAESLTPSEPSDIFTVRPWGGTSWADDVPLSLLVETIRAARDAGLSGPLAIRQRDDQVFDAAGCVVVLDDDGAPLASYDVGMPFGRPRLGRPPLPDDAARSEIVQVRLTRAELVELDARRGGESRSAWLAAPLRA